MTPYALQSLMTKGAQGNFTEQLKQTDSSKDVTAYSLRPVHSRKGYSVMDYMNVALTVSPEYIVTPCEQLLPHSGRKKKTLTGVQALEMFEHAKTAPGRGDTKLLCPIWLDHITLDLESTDQG